MSRLLAREAACACLATVISLAAGTAFAAGTERSLNPKFEKYTLPNGLEVILHEDHSIPMVAVNVWYHVGSKNEAPGRTGFAHLFEHMMFQGSKHADSDYFSPIEKAGGDVNGSTNRDRTNYWENVPSNYLEMALYLESDRMGYLVPAMTQEKLDNQRDVVKNERRQGRENAPYGKAEELYLPALYPRDHPYSWPVIGSMADLSAASLEDVSNFFKQYYTPNNASLCIAGDFKPEEAKRLVEKYFAPLPPGPAVDRLSGWIPELDGVRRVQGEDNVSLARVYYLWHSPAFYQPGDAELDILANALTSGKTSRLYKSLVYEREIAQDVVAYQASQELSSTFVIQATVREGHSPAEVEAALDAELRAILKSGIRRQELDQAVSNYEADFTRSIEEIGGFGGRADALNRYNVMLGDPGRFDWDLARYRRATTAGVLEAARRWIDLDRRVILTIVPYGSPAAAGADTERAGIPAAAAEPTFAPPAIQRDKLANGLEIYVVHRPDLPLVQANLLVKSGWVSDPPTRFGTAALTAELLDEGTRSQNALAISDRAKSLGAQLSTGSSFDGSTVSLNVLRKNLAGGLELMTDVVLHPVFPAEELERQRAMYLGRIKQEAKQPQAAAIKAYQREVFGVQHPYSQPFTGSGTEETIKAITRDDLVKFYQSNYFANNAALIFVGDITMDEARTMAGSSFGKWGTGTVSHPVIAAPPRASGKRIVIVDKPGAAQSMIVAGQPGMQRSNPDYVAFHVMNNALGGQFTSRINMNLREDKGYTYGSYSFLRAMKDGGLFAVLAPVQTQNTKESVIEIMKEMTDVTGARPLADNEVTDSKLNLIKGFPQSFQGNPQIAGMLGNLVLYGLPLDDWQTYASRVQKVDGAAASSVARKYIDPSSLVIVIVGDRAKIEEGLRDLKIGDVVLSSAQ